MPSHPTSFLQDASIPQVARREYVPLVAEAISALIASFAAAGVLGVIYLVQMAAGCRQSEALGLKWADIGTDHIIIRDKLDEKTRTSMATKTKGSKRRVPIPIAVIAEIEKLRPKNASPDAYVFLNKRGRPFLASNLRRSWRKLRERFELPDTLKNKDLRHENASRLALAGVHPKNVQERLGQSSIRVTMDVYSHLMPGMDSQAVDVIDRMLKPTPVVAQPENAESGK